MEELTCANCGRKPHDPAYILQMLYPDYKLEVTICGHCWVCTFIAPLMDHRLRRLAIKSAQERLPGI
jgi:hypothetical protein